MRSIRLILLIGLAACGTDVSTGSTPDATPTARATWYQDVAPIAAKHCMSCHRTGGIAPFSLTDYDDARENAPMLLAPIDSGVMPPFDAREEADCTPRFGWKDDPRLSAQEIATIHAWVEDGAQPGTVTDVPPPPNTDLTGVTQTLKPLVPFTASGDRDLFMCTVLDPNTTGEWLTGMQVRPGNPNVVHHVVLTELEAGTDQNTLVAQHGIGMPWDCSNMATPGGFVVNIWTPGNEPLQTDGTLAVPIAAGAKLVMQIHYHPAGKVNDPDTTSVDLRTTLSWPQKMYFVTALGNATTAPLLLSDPDDRSPTIPEFRIPANKADHTESMRFPITDLGGLTDVRIYSVNPHMHLLGTHIAGQIQRAVPTSAQPANECLANGNWNFDWQRTYLYDTTLASLPTISVGDVIDVQCHWNNTLDNPFEQRALADAGLVAPVDVTLGEGQSTDEMCLEIFGLAIPAPPPATGRTIPTPAPALARLAR